MFKNTRRKKIGIIIHANQILEIKGGKTEAISFKYVLKKYRICK